MVISKKCFCGDAVGDPAMFAAAVGPVGNGMRTIHPSDTRNGSAVESVSKGAQK